MICPTGSTLGGLLLTTSLSNRRKKAEMQSLDNAFLSCLSVNMIKSNSNLLAFFEEDKGGVVFPNWDLLVISTKIMGALVHRIMIDNETFCNIIFIKTLDFLGNFNDYIEPCEIRIRSFRNQSVHPYRMICFGRGDLLILG